MPPTEYEQPLDLQGGTLILAQSLEVANPSLYVGIEAIINNGKVDLTLSNLAPKKSDSLLLGFSFAAQGSTGTQNYKPNDWLLTSVSQDFSGDGAHDGFTYALNSGSPVGGQKDAQIRWNYDAGIATLLQPQLVFYETDQGMFSDYVQLPAVPVVPEPSTLFGGALLLSSALALELLRRRK